MPGGLIQLAAYGSENLYLMGNPEITFFKVVYKQHTNFSVEPIEIPFSSQHNISEVSTKPTTLKVKIPRLADLLSNIFLKVELPDIISSIYRKFQWAEGIGEIMVQSATLYIGGTKIETITSEWINIYHRLNLPAEKKKLYDILVGNTSDLYNPEISSDTVMELIRKCFLENPHPKNMSKSNDLHDDYSDIIGKVEALIDGTEVDDTTREIKQNMPRVISDLLHLLENFKTLQKSNIPYYDPEDVIENQTPLHASIKGKQLYIPLPFFFTKNIGLSLPLIALQYQDVEVQIEFSPISYLFTILDWNSELKRYMRRRPNPLKEAQRLSYYVYSHIPVNLPNNSQVNNTMNTRNKKSNTGDDYIECDDIIDNENIKLIDDDGEETTKVNIKTMAMEKTIQNAYNNNNFLFNISLEACFIFLDEDERNLFSSNSHEYLIEQVTFRNDEGYHGKKSQYEMSLYNPVKEIIWVLKRSDIEQYNIWFNYTNYILSKSQRELGNIFPNEYYQVPDDSVTTHMRDVMNTNILQTAKILFNGIDRFDYKDATFLNYVQPFMYHSNTADGIYMFSFSLEPEKYQPSGSVNMSMVNTVTLDFETSIPPIDPEISEVLNNKSDPTTSAHIRNSFGIQLQNMNTGGQDFLSYVTDKEIFQYTYNLNLYVINYNVLKIMSGMAGLAYNT